MSHSAMFPKHGFRLLLAMLALFVKLVVPPGFMPAAPDGLGLVICSGHGALQPGTDVPAPDHDGGRHLDHPCAFSGHFAAAPPPAPMKPIPAVAVFAAIPNARPPQSAPGRGLAAPPPPSQAPPSRTI